MTRHRLIACTAPMLLAACAPQPANRTDPAAAPTAVPTAAAATPDHTPHRRRPSDTPGPAGAGIDGKGANAAAGATTRGCYLAVDGVVHVDGPCLVFPMGRDQYTLNTWDRGKPAHPHFAVVSAAPDGGVRASWNADPADDRALDPLGAVTRSGSCWVNRRARICVR